ncbi:MAG: CPBP family intramembrane metalloprotease [Bacteroidetes bacterium]|nr:CPBP family intramembrane metalloprotease [Bacteroidota bacterium]
MKKIYKYLISFIKDDFNLWIYGFAFVFMIIAISFNYSVGFEKKILNKYYHEPIGILYYFLFYAFSYYLISVPKLYFCDSKNVLSNKKFWIKSLAFLALLGIVAGFSILESWAKMYVDYEYYYISKISANLRFVIVFVLPLFIIWKIADKEMPTFYGFSFKNLDIKPYFKMLLIMVPFIAIASTQADFMSTYPKFKPWFIQGNVFNLTRFQMSSIYELSYSLNFISLELFFRGALVIGMVAIMGRHAVLPMAVTYCFLHFGKPVAECVSSFFGGYLLGVIALYTRSIFGGCIVHLGVAYLMEFAALLQYYVFMKK